MKRADGGPAFPVAGKSIRYGDGPFIDLDGMTLRDYFAAKAMAAMQVQCWHWPDDMSGFAEYAANASKTAYAIADAMLAERAK